MNKSSNETKKNGGMVFSHINRPLNETKGCGGGFFSIQQTNKTNESIFEIIRFFH